MHAHCGVLRERVLRAADALLRPPPDDGPRRAGRRRGRPRPQPARAAIARADRRASAAAFPSWSSSTTTPPRCRTAPSAPASCAPSCARRFGAGGYRRPRLGPRLRRAARRRLSALRPARASTCRCATEGDVDARVWIRIREVEQSLSLIEQILERPAGRADCRADVRAPRRRRGHGAGRGLPRRRPGLGARSARTAASSAATCATRPGSSGRCSRR